MLLKASALTFNSTGHPLKIRTKVLSYYFKDSPTHLKSHISIKRTVYPKIVIVYSPLHHSTQPVRLSLFQQFCPYNESQLGPKQHCIDKKYENSVIIYPHVIPNLYDCLCFKGFAPTMKANGVHNNIAQTNIFLQVILIT